MARMIKYPTLCAYCNKMIAKGKGYLQRVSGKWLCHCLECYKKKAENNGIQKQ